MTSSCKAVDAWMQHPTKRFMTDDIFTSLLRWNRLDPVQFQQEEHPIYSTQMSLSSMDSGLVEAGLISAWYSPQGPMISNEDVRKACAAHPGRFFGVASGDIRDPVRCVQEIRNFVQNHGFVAVRILPWLWQKYANDPLFYPIYTACVELGVPLCLQVPSVIQAAQCGHYPIDGRLQEVFEAIRGGKFSEGEPDAQAEFNSILDRLCNLQAAGTWDGDRYLVIHDFPSFVDAQAKVDATYKDKATWCRLSIQAASSMSRFSTDRTIAEYADVIWGVKPARRELEPVVVGSVPVPKPKAECILKVDAIPKAARPVKDTLRPGTLSADAKAEPKQGKVNVQESDAAADGSAS
ncbi:unnamed protein product [Symbiodinium sp. CCMP2456]|nr:unnamed protein product [Symbiodinium sp. CCMP2456]